MADDLDRAMMELAVEQARKAESLGEVPIGAVVVQNGQVIASAHNRREIDNDPFGHAELIAMTNASKALGVWRLTGCEVFVTLEPCIMCAGAMVLARIDRLVYGATDPKAGAVGSLYEILADDRLNHRVEVTAGVQAEQCGAMLTEFFRKRRGQG
jgi:tRNA(Arg) A34 adenosine deaminase TadA